MGKAKEAGETTVARHAGKCLYIACVRERGRSERTTLWLEMLLSSNKGAGLKDFVAS